MVISICGIQAMHSCLKALNVNVNYPISNASYATNLHPVQSRSRQDRVHRNCIRSMRKATTTTMKTTGNRQLVPGPLAAIRVPDI